MSTMTPGISAKVYGALNLMNSMIESGERHSDISRSVLADAKLALARMEKELVKYQAELEGAFVVIDAYTEVKKKLEFKLVTAKVKERERCAKLVEDAPYDPDWSFTKLAAAIRNMSKEPEKLSKGAT